MSFPSNTGFNRLRKRLYLPATLLFLLLVAFLVLLGDLMVRFETYITRVERFLVQEQASQFRRVLQVSYPMESADPAAIARYLQPLFQELTSASGLIRSAGLVNSSGKYIVHTEHQYVGRSFTSSIDLSQVLFDGAEVHLWPAEGSVTYYYAARYELLSYQEATKRQPPFDLRLALVLEVNLKVLEAGRGMYSFAKSMLTGLFVTLVGVVVYLVLSVNRYYAVNRALDSLESYMSILLDNLSSAVVSVDNDGKIVGTNRLIEELFKVQEDDIRGKGIETLLPGEENQHLRKLIQDKLRIRHQDVLVTLGGKEIPMGLRLNEIISPLGEPAGKLIVFEDEREIHELKKQVQRSDRLASLGRMASMIAHEVRNPLNTIGGHAQMIRDEIIQHDGTLKAEEQDQWTRSLTLITSEIDRLNRVVSELLHFSAPVVLDWQTVSINQVVRESLEFMESDAEIQNIRIESNFDPALPPLRFDGGKLKQVLLNIYLNAFDAMNSGGTLTVSTHYQPNRNRWQISVEDTGHGIRAEHLPLLFDPYFTTKKNGAGLGLSIVHNTIENLGGTVQVSSTVGKGTRFTLTFPVEG